MTTSISSNLLAGAVNKNLSGAQKLLSKASAMMSSGERITKASDDAAGLSVGTGLKTDVATLKTALGGTTQAKSLLAIADGALKEIGDIVQRQKSLSVQANMGSSSDNERAYFDEEFQQLTKEIDRLVDQTNFNNLKLIDGSISGAGGLEANTEGSADTSSVALTFTAIAGTANADNALIINGVQFDFDFTGAATVSTGADIVINGTLTTNKASTIAGIINNTDSSHPHSGMTQANRDRLSELVAVANGNVLTITSKKTGVAGLFNVTAGGDADIDDYITNVTAGTRSITPAVTAATVSSSYAPGSVTGSLGRSSVSVTGTMGNTTIEALTQTQATSGWTTVAAGNIGDGDTINAFGRSFTLQNNVTNAETQIKRSTTSDLETLQNIATFMNNSDDPNIANYYFEARLDSGNNQLKITSRGSTTFVNDSTFILDSAAIEVDAGTAGAAAGLDVSRITDNPSFMGQIDGFIAKMTGTDSVKLSVKVGDYVYSANIADTTPGATQAVRLKSEDLNGKGGWFDLRIATDNAVATQSDADTFAAKINTAIKELTFYQTRELDSFNTKGTSLEETVVTMTAKDFATTEVASVDILSSRLSTSQEAKMSIKLKDGRVFENSTDLNEKINKGTLIQLTSTTDSNEKINIHFGRTLDVADATAIERAKSDFLAAFKASTVGMDFQVGFKSDQVITVQIGDASTNALYGAKKLDVTTVDSSGEASAELDKAINRVKSLRASIGAYQSRFDSAASNIETSIQNTDAARAAFLDANIPEASTQLAVAQVMMQASISVLAQMNQLPQALLKLIG